MSGPSLSASAEATPGIRFVYMTVGDRETAETISKALVEERLAACTNVIDGMTSYFRWEGQVKTDRELIVIAKTREDRVAALTERVKALHPYDCACIVALPAAADEGNTDFLSWIRREAAGLDA